MSNFTRKLRSLAMVAVLGSSLSLVAQDRSIDITIENLTPTNGDFTISPSDENFRYVWSFMPSDDFNAIEDIFVYSKKSVDNTYDIYQSYYPDYTWEKAVEDATITKDDYNYYQESRFKWELSTGLIPDTDYTIYAYAFNNDLTGGDLYKKEFRTPGVPASDNTFDVKVVSMKIDSPEDAENKTVTVTVKVTPASDETYVVEWQRKEWTDGYDLSTKLGVDKFVSENLGVYASKFNGEQTLTFKKQKLDSDFYLFIYGLNEEYSVPNTDVQVIPVHTEDKGDVAEKDFVLEVTEITQTGAHIRIIPGENVKKYYWCITYPENIERWGGREVFDVTMDRGWWQYLADMYSDLTWIDVMNMFLTEGPIDDYSKNMPDDVESLRWDKDCVLYAYGLDENGERTTDIYFADFHTLPRNESDLDFEFEVVSVEDDPTNSFGSNVCHKVTIDIYPSNDTEQYAFKFHEVKYLDQYDDDSIDDYIFDQFMYGAMYATDAARVVMPGIREDRSYYLVVMGWDEAPNTDVYTYEFDYASTGVKTVTSEEVIVKAVRGGISIDGAFDFAAITTADGRVVASPRHSGAVTSLAPGVYIVNYTCNGVRNVKKILVK